MHATLRKLLITLPIALALSTAAWAQTTAIEGDVKGVDGKGLAGANHQNRPHGRQGQLQSQDRQEGPLLLRWPGDWDVQRDAGSRGHGCGPGVSLRTSLGDPKDVNFDMKQIQARNGAGAAAGGGGEPPAAEQERGMSAAQKAEFEKQKKEARSGDGRRTRR